MNISTTPATVNLHTTRGANNYSMSVPHGSAFSEIFEVIEEFIAAIRNQEEQQKAAQAAAVQATTASAAPSTTAETTA